MDALSDESSRSNATLCVNIIAAAFAWGVRNGSVKTNPAKGVEKFKLETKERVLDDDEWNALGQKLDGEASATAAALDAFLAPTGWRRNEAVGFTFDSSKTRIAALPDTKSGLSIDALSL
jgi:integrase